MLDFLQKDEFIEIHVNKQMLVLTADEYRKAVRRGDVVQKAQADAFAKKVACLEELKK